jgi:hypothetical protein
MIYEHAMTPNISPQLSAQLDASSRTAHILWFALMMSVCIYGGVSFIIASQGDEATSELGLPSFVFPLLSVAAVAAGVVLYRQLTSPDRLRALVNQQRSVEQVPGHVLTASILRWALFESVAIYGLVLAIMSHSFEAFLPYGIVAIAFQAMSPPRLKQITLSALALLPADTSRS